MRLQNRKAGTMQIISYLNRSCNLLHMWACGLMIASGGGHVQRDDGFGLMN